MNVYHVTSGKWPSDLSEIPDNMRPVFNPREIRPYYADQSYEKPGYYNKIGGFFVTYNVKDGQPQLVVGRRDLRYSYDWSNKTWKQ